MNLEIWVYNDYCDLVSCSFLSAFFSSMIWDSILSPSISSNFGANNFMNGSNCFSILNVIVLSLTSNSNCFRNRNSWRALIFCFWSVIVLLILYV